jgi:hypothetical protein
MDARNRIFSYLFNYTFEDKVSYKSLTDIIRDFHRDLIMMSLLKQQFLTTKSSLLK